MIQKDIAAAPSAGSSSSERSLALLALVAAEGRAHARSRFRFGELADCLRGEGLRVRRFRAERQELLIAKRNGRGGVTQERRPQ